MVNGGGGDGVSSSDEEGVVLLLLLVLLVLLLLEESLRSATDGLFLSVRTILGGEGVGGGGVVREGSGTALMELFIRMVTAGSYNGWRVVPDVGLSIFYLYGCSDVRISAISMGRGGHETFIVGIWGPEAPRSAKTSTFNHSFCADTTCGHDVRTRRATRQQR